MEGGWLVSYFVLWGLVLTMGVVILAHSRLLGILHHRFGPAGAKPLADGPAVGSQVDRIVGHISDGTAWTWDFPAPAALLLVFVSPQCETCDTLMPHVKDFAKAHTDVQVVLMSTLRDRRMNEAYIAYRRLEKLTYVLAAELADAMDIQGTPYAVLVDCYGRVRAKGLVNHYEHLRSLLFVPSGDTEGSHAIVHEEHGEQGAKA